MMNMAFFNETSSHRRPCLKTNERGFILLAALFILMVLSILGAVALTTTRYEFALSGNDKLIVRLKTRAESAAATAAERLEHLPKATLRDSDWTSPTRLPWLSRGLNDRFDALSDSTKYQNLADYTQDLSYWINQDNAPSNCAILRPDTDDPTDGPFSDKFPDCRFQVIDVEVSQGSSLQTGNHLSTMHNLYITGVSRQGNAKRMVQFGYRKEY